MCMWRKMGEFSVGVIFPVLDFLKAEQKPESHGLNITEFTEAVSSDSSD